MTSMTQLTVPNFRTAMRSLESARAATGAATMATSSRSADRRPHRREQGVARTISSRNHGDAPRQAADRNRFQRLERHRIDDRHVIREAVCNVELAAVRAERELPRPLAHQDVLLDLVGFGVDDGDPIGTSEGHESGAAVGRELQPDRADVLLVDARNVEVDDVYDLMACRIDDRYRASDFRRYPQIPLVRRVYHDPRPGI